MSDYTSFKTYINKEKGVNPGAEHAITMFNNAHAGMLKRLESKKNKSWNNDDLKELRKFLREIYFPEKFDKGLGSNYVNTFERDFFNYYNNATNSAISNTSKIGDQYYSGAKGLTQEEVLKIFNDKRKQYEEKNKFIRMSCGKAKIEFDKAQRCLNELTNIKTASLSSAKNALINVYNSCIEVINL